jgi:Dynamin family
MPQAMHRQSVLGVGGSRSSCRKVAVKSTEADRHPLQPRRVADGRSKEIAALLDRALSSLGDRWPPNALIAQRLREIRGRLMAERLQLAIVGQFKRGKSAFLNALLGAPLLPTGVIPLTAIPTFITWGSKPCIRIAYKTTGSVDEFEDVTPDAIRNRLFGFVAEEANPKNRLAVARVDLFYPAAFLENGVVLIDTPGIGSTYRHNTDAALEVLPECDAALFVVSADPPITETELAYLETVRPKVARLFFVLNKADYLEPDELGVAVDFLVKTVRQISLADDLEARVFAVSALRGLRAKQNGNGAALELSGMAAVETYLFHYLAQEKVDALRTAVCGKACQFLLEAEANLSLRVRALEMPLDDLRKRVSALEGALSRISDEDLVIRDLLSGDRRRAVEQLEIYAEQLRQKARRYLMALLDRALSEGNPENADTLAREAIADAIPEFFEQELTQTSSEFSRTVEEILARHQQRIDDLVNLVRRTAADLFDVPYAEAAESERFKLGPEPYWVKQQWQLTSERMVSLSTGLTNRLLPANFRQARRRSQLEELVNELVQRNIENLRWSTLQGLNGTFRRLTTMLEERLGGALEATQGAVKAAAASRLTQSNRADVELTALQEISRSLAEIREALMKASLPGEALCGTRSASPEERQRRSIAARSGEGSTDGSCRV